MFNISLYSKDLMGSISVKLIYLKVVVNIIMRTHFSLPSLEGETDEGKAPINARFEIHYFTISGLKVSIKIKK
jgi:hypothetical protein